MDPRVSALTVSDSISRKKTWENLQETLPHASLFPPETFGCGVQRLRAQGPTLQGGGLCMEQRTAGQVPALVPHFLFLLRLACPPGVTVRSK